MSKFSETEIIVRGYHLDVYQHVNNARYLEFLEEARWAYLDAEQSISWFEERNLAMFIVNINVNYRYPATLNDHLIIKTKLEHFKTKSVVVHQDIFLKGTDTKVLDADVTFVIMDMKSRKVIELSDEIKNFFT